MNKKIFHLIAVLGLVLGLVRSTALASSPQSPALPETPNSSISGVVTTEMGVPIPGVTVQVSTGTSVTTDVYGSYVVPDLPDGTYTLTPVFGSHTFTPSSRTVTVPPDATNQDFVYIAPKPPTPQVFLPLVLKDLVVTPIDCPDFYDDFSNPDSGWHVGEDQEHRSEYLNGEYRGLVKPASTLFDFGAPTCARQNYSVEVYAHWGDYNGDAYGLSFGITGNYDNYYAFEVSSDYQEFELLRSSPEGWVEIVPWTVYPGIQVGKATNHLKATRNGTAITLEINGATVGTWNDGNITGDTYSGVNVSSYTDSPNADARFDNFKVTSLIGSALVAGQASSLEQTVSGLDGKAPLSYAYENLYARLSKEKPVR